MPWWMYALGTACMWGVVPLLEKTSVRHVSPEVALFWRIIGSSLGLVTVPLLSREVRSGSIQIPVAAAVALIVAGFLGSVAGQWTNLTAQKLQEVSRVAPIIASWPVITFVLAVWWLHESFSLQKVVAVILIVTGVVLLTRP